ncbi:PH domain-containing protein [Micromonospora sp. NPDC005707]|uniref:PH domain-containing protein n=1 Tax=Micromonospora sp. NPDC005707 TaxID=3157050 RepID=UPI0034001C0C
MRKALGLLRRVIVYEWRMWRSLFRWLLRRPVAPAEGAEAFGYIGAVKPILIAFIALSAVEIPIFDVIIRHTMPWQAAREVALGLGIWGVLWMIGLYAALQIHPHVAHPAGLRVRNGFSVDFTVPWEAVARVDARYRSLTGSRTVQVERTEAGTVLNIVTGKQTSVDLVLHRPLSVRLPSGPSEPATEIRLYADDPGALVKLARQHLPTPNPTTRPR